MTASGHRKRCGVGARGACGDSSQDKLNLCHRLMARGVPMRGASSGL